ncbi:MAG: TonB-dependent receptor, partial [Nitrospira sp.]|nr:TonB-dependent receptor [Nitrospira sp.]
TIDLLAVDHIEVYKGAQASKFGANSLGGAVNFVLKTGVNQSTVQVRGEGGSFGLYNSQLASGQTTKPFSVFGETAKGDYYVSVTGSGQDGYRMHAQQHAVRFNANVGVSISDRHQARVTVIHANVLSQLPGPLSLQEFETNPRQAGAWEDVGGNLLVCGRALPCRYTNDSRLSRVGLAYQYRDEAGGLLTVAPFYQYWKWNSNFTQILDHLTQDTGAEVRYSHTSTLLGWSHRWVIGASPWYGMNRLNLFKNDFGSLGDILQNRSIQTLNLGAYVEDEIHVLPSVALILGGRLDYSSRRATVTDFSPPGTLTGTRTGERVFSAFNPRAGFIVHTSDTSQLYGNVSRGYEAPINIQLMQPLNAQSLPPTDAFLDVDAQRAWQFELGHRGVARHGDLAWDIAAYDLEMRKEILVTALRLSGIGEVATFRNAGASRHLGVEAGGSLVLAKGLFAPGSDHSQDCLAIRTAYTWRRYRFLDEVSKVSNGVVVADAQSGHAIPGIPSHWITGELKYAHPLGWWIAPNIEWSPAGYFVDFDNKVKNPPFFIVNLKIGYTYQHWTMFFEGRNLTDQNYSGSVMAGGFNGANAGTSRAFLPSWPLSFFGGLSVRWS